MGCTGSKSKKNAYARVAQYQKESWAVERSLKVPPEPLDWATPPPGCVTPSCLHNFLTDGFYAPFAANPRYLLLVDCRTRKAFVRKRLLTSRWFKDLQSAPPPQKCFSVVLYDDVPRTAPPSPCERDPLSCLYHEFKKQRLDPLVVVGGWPTIEVICSHLTVTGEDTETIGERESPRVSLPWYPTLVVPGFLYLGQAGMAADPRILTQLHVTHVVALSDVIPRRVLPSTNYLVVPLPESDPVCEETAKELPPGSPQEPDLVSSMPTILAFVGEAKGLGGSVLVYCDQGFTRAALIVMALMMSERHCTLEDAFYYVKAARSAVSPHLGLLKQLLAYEASLFGAPVTAIEELF